MKKNRQASITSDKHLGKKTMALAAVLAVILCATIGGTIAYLMDQTDPVVNTFTYGNVNIKLEESDPNIDGDNDPATMPHTYYGLPGQTIAKDPKVTVTEKSVACWLFVKLEKSDNFDDFMTYEMAEGWTKLDGYDNVYYREVSESDEDQKFQVIKGDEIYVKTSVTKEMIDGLTGENAPTLTIKASAVQKYGFDTAVNAYTQVSAVTVSTAEELQEALSSGEGSVRLEKDIVVEKPLVVNSKAAIDLNGKTISNEQDIWNEDNDSWSLISVENGGDLTINGDGKIKAKENDSYAADVRDGGTLTINGGTYEGNIHAVYVYGGNLVINDGTFMIQQLWPTDENAYDYVINSLDEAWPDSSEYEPETYGTSTIVVNGGTFQNFDPSNSKSENPVADFVPEGHSVTSETTDGVTWYIVR